MAGKFFPDRQNALCESWLLMGGQIYAGEGLKKDICAKKHPRDKIR